MIRIVILGSIGQSVECLEYIFGNVSVSTSDVKVVAYIPHQNPTEFCLTAECIALVEKHGVKILNLKLLNELDYDLGISICFDQKLSKEVVKKPKRGWVNIHLGPLPRLRGSLSAHHAVRLAPIANIWEFSTTMHYMDEEIDTGPIIDVESFPIHVTDTAYDVYVKALSKISILFSRNIKSLVSSSDRVASYSQSGETNYFKRKDINHQVDLSEPESWILAKIRALTFPNKPRPFTLIGGKKIFLSLD